MTNMTQDHGQPACWRRSHVTSPVLPDPVAVVVATGLPYRVGSNRLQTLALYLPETEATRMLVGTPVHRLPGLDTDPGEPSCLVHIHGGAWRSPEVTAASIEPTVAHAFADPADTRLRVIASIDYTLSPFPNAPTNAYDPVVDGHADPAREAVHPLHLDDVLHAFALLRSFGLVDGSYVLSGHSCGACLAFQAMLADPADFGLHDVGAPPAPAAVLGINGLYDLPDLVHDLDAPHSHLAGEYRTLLSIAFGADERVWASASPARLDPVEIADHVRRAGGPSTILLEQSPDDQLVPMNQRERFARRLAETGSLQVIEGGRCSGQHAAPWERGDIMWRSLADVLDRCRSSAPSDRNSEVE